MKLWTWQTLDFDLTRGTVEHGRSEVHAGLPGLAVAQDEIFRRLGVDQIIWCHVRKQDSTWFNSTATPPRCEWELDVPFREVIEITQLHRVLDIRVPDEGSCRPASPLAS